MDIPTCSPRCGASSTRWPTRIRPFTTEVAERLADRLIEDAPPGLSHVYLVSGGSEAIEAALKMARQYFVEIGQPQRRHLIARRQSYHGNTLGALAVGGNGWRRAQFEPLLIETDHIDPCYAYRLQREGESDADYAARAARALEDKLIEIGPDRVIAFVAETVVGATAGAVRRSAIISSKYERFAIVTACCSFSTR